MQYQVKHNRQQIEMICLEQLVAADSFARVVDAFVDVLDFDQLNFTNHQLNKEGQQPYHPSDMLKLYLYSYRHGIRSCRKIQHATKTNIEVMWLIGKLQPHYKTIANFRKDNADAFKHVFRHFLLLLKSWKLIEGKTFAIDSFKIRAQNSLKNNFNDRKIKRHLEYIDNKIEEYERELDKEKISSNKENLKKKIEHQQYKKRNYQNLQQQLDTTEDGQISTTDPDSRGVVFQRTSVKIGYNIQAVSDDKNMLLVAFDTGDVNDTHQLANMAKQAMSNTQSNKCNLLADKGYHTGTQLQQCEDMNATPFVAPKANSASVVNGVFSVEEFTYNANEDTYKCPAGHTMRSNGSIYTRASKKKNVPDISFKHYLTKECALCDLKTQCTARKHGRIVQRSQHQDAIDRNNERIYQNPDYYRNRQQIIEHQFGTIKRQWKLDHCLMKTKQNVLTEIAIAFTTYNLCRAMSIIHPIELIKRLKALLSPIFAMTSALDNHIKKVFSFYLRPSLASRIFKLYL